MDYLTQAVDYFLQHWKGAAVLLIGSGGLWWFIDKYSGRKERLEDRKDRARELTLAFATSVGALQIKPTPETCAAFRTAFDNWRNSPVVRKELGKDTVFSICNPDGNELYRITLRAIISDEIVQRAINFQALELFGRLGLICNKLKV